MFKKIKVLFIIFIISILALTGCGANNSRNTTPLSKAEFNQLYSDSSKYEGRRVDFFARIFNEPEKDDKGIYLRAYANDDHSKITIISFNDTQLSVKNGDIINVTGTVGKAGKKAPGAALTTPSILASEIGKYDYAPAFRPAIKTIRVSKEINQNGYILTLNKVEVAEKETRLYININNTTKNKVRFYSSKTNITQGNKRFKGLINLDEKVPEIDNDILPGLAKDGVLILEPVQANGENLKVIFEGAWGNYDLNFTRFTFDAVLK